MNVPSLDYKNDSYVEYETKELGEIQNYDLQIEQSAFGIAINQAQQQV